MFPLDLWRQMGDFTRGKKRRREQGFVLMISALVIVFILILVLPFLSKVSAQLRTTEKSFRSLSALNLAEAGVEKAIWELNYGDINSWAGDSVCRSLTMNSLQTHNGAYAGDVDVLVFDPEGAFPVVESKGLVPFEGKRKVEKTVRVVLGKGFDPYFNFAIFADEGLDMAGNSYTDSYNSAIAPYDPLSPGSYGDMGTNAKDRWDVVLLNNIVVNGDARTGYKSDPFAVIRLRNNAKINGLTGTLEKPKILTPYPAPTLPFRGDFYLPRGRPEVIISESGEYSSFALGANTGVTLSGQVTVFINGDFSMDSNSYLNISYNSSAELILGNGTFDQASNSSINNLTQDPKNLAILGTADFTTMNWRSNSDFWGVVYVPEASINYSANSDFYGSIVCNYIYLNSQSGIHYDESLGLWKKYGDSSDLLVVRSWQLR